MRPRVKQALAEVTQDILAAFGPVKTKPKEVYAYYDVNLKAKYTAAPSAVQYLVRAARTSEYGVLDLSLLVATTPVEVATELSDSVKSDPVKLTRAIINQVKDIKKLETECKDFSYDYDAEFLNDDDMEDIMREITG